MTKQESYGRLPGTDLRFKSSSVQWYWNKHIYIRPRWLRKLPVLSKITNGDCDVFIVKIVGLPPILRVYSYPGHLSLLEVFFKDGVSYL
jgi:hypothetical protein